MATLPNYINTCATLYIILYHIYAIMPLCHYMPIEKQNMLKRIIRENTLFYQPYILKSLGRDDYEKQYLFIVTSLIYNL